MRRFGWLVGSLLALTVVIAMDADQGLTGLADRLHNMHLSSEAEPFEPSSSRTGTTLDNTAVPFQPRHGRGKQIVAAHFDPAAVDTTRTLLKACGDSLKNLLETAKDTGSLQSKERAVILRIISGQLGDFTNTGLPTTIDRAKVIVKDFDEFLTHLANLWVRPKSEQTDGRDKLLHLLDRISSGILLRLYAVAEDLEVLALLWNLWPTKEPMVPELSRGFSDHNDAHLVALSRAIRAQVTAILEGRLEGRPGPRIGAFEKYTFRLPHWTWEMSLVKALEKRTMDLEALHFYEQFFNEQVSNKNLIPHTLLAERRARLTNERRHILPKLGGSERTRFQKLLERMDKYEADSKAAASQATHHFGPDTFFFRPPQLGQAPPDGWVATQGYAQPGKDEFGRDLLNVQVQHAAIVPNHPVQYGSTYTFAQPQPGGYPGAYPGGYPGGVPGGYPGGAPGAYAGGGAWGPPQPAYHGQGYGWWRGHGPNA